MTPRRWQWTGLWAGSALFALVALDFLVGGPVSALDQPTYDRITAWNEAGWPVHWWSEALTKVTAPLQATLVTAAVAAYWWARGQRRLAAWGVGASLVTALAITALKFTFRRELSPMAAGAWYGFSFPSGHTVGAAANLGLLILLAAQYRVNRLGLQGPAAHRTWAVAVACWALLFLVTGIGRILTQMHWASDVFASWGVGLALTCGALLLANIPSAPAAIPGATAAGPHFASRAT